ncbi:hypothetical protein [Streptomyces sp. NBC_00344]|uniref:hypothetical protein n=1 Tax=Streptomyces sp. NBC_00344 TaxID=2975720 RepID=UPI002E1C001F
MSDSTPEPSGPQPGPATGAVHDPAAPAPLGLTRTPTGDDGIDLVLERLGDADHLAADGHIEVYEDVHRGLREALDALDTPPGPPAPAPGPHPYNSRS